MKTRTRKVELIMAEGVGSEVLDIIEATVNYEMSGDGCILIHTDDLYECNTPTKIAEILKAQHPTYEGLVFLRR